MGHLLPACLSVCPLLSRITSVARRSVTLHRPPECQRHFLFSRRKSVVLSVGIKINEKQSAGSQFSPTTSLNENKCSFACCSFLSARRRIWCIGRICSDEKPNSQVSCARDLSYFFFWCIVCRFVARDAYAKHMHSAVYATARCLSFCLSVCPVLELWNYSWGVERQSRLNCRLTFK